MNKGWISLHRGIEDCWVWRDKPFAKGQAWIDLLLLANHKDVKIPIDGKPKLILRGQLHTSIVKLSVRWGWDRRKVGRFLDNLEFDQMVTQERTENGTTITIVKYEDFQTYSTTDGTPDGTPHSTTDGTPDGTQTINKQLNNVNNVNKNNIYSSNFEEFWKVYPRKVDKAKANKCYQARVKEGWSEDELLKAAKAYADSCKKNGTEDKYIKHGATFLSAGTPFTDYLKGSENNESVGTNEGHYDERARRLLASRGVFLS